MRAYRDQAERFDRLADRCQFPTFVACYCKLAEDYRRRAEMGSHGPAPEGQPSQTDFLTRAVSNSRQTFRNRGATVYGCLGGAAMPIRPFLEGEVFEQELIDTMSKALADACRELGLKDKEDAVVRLLAMRIIDATREGIHGHRYWESGGARGARPGTQALRPPQVAAACSSSSSCRYCRRTPPN